MTTSIRWRPVLLSLVVASIAFAGCAKKTNDAGASRGARPASVADTKEPPINTKTRFAAGRLAESQGNLPRAIQQYEAALRSDAGHLPSLYRLGVVHAQAKQFDQAIDAWTRYVKATDGSPAAYANLGFCHELSGDLSEAEAAYEKGIARDDKSEPCRVNYGLMLARLGRSSEALLQLQAVLPPAAVQYNLASVLEQQGQREQAKAGYRKALEIDPNFTDAQSRLAALEKAGSATSPSSSSSAAAQ
jgi:superkiller protein 3